MLCTHTCPPDPSVRPAWNAPKRNSPLPSPPPDCSHVLPHIQQPEQKPGVTTIFSASLPTSHPPSKPECFCCLHASEFHLLSTPHLNSGHGFTQAHTDTTPSLHTCMIILLFSLEVLHVSQFRQYKIFLPWHKLEFSSLSGPFINCRLYL